jgi:hypothetical protein
VQGSTDGRGTPLSREAIEQADDEDLALLAWDVVWADSGRSSIEHRTVFLVELLNYEIGNGGLVQYFHNTEDVDVAETPPALERVGATHHRSLFDEALRRWNRERSSLEALWEQGVEGFSQSYKVSTLGELDVLPEDVVDSVHGWVSSEAGVGAVMVVEVQPSCKRVGAGAF